MVIRNSILDLDYESKEYDAQLEEESKAHDDVYIEEGNSIFLTIRRALHLQMLALEKS